MIDSLSFVGKVNGEKTKQRHRMKGKKGMEKNQLANKYGILMSFVERNSNNFGIGSNLRAEKLFPTPSKSTFPNRRLCSIKCAQATPNPWHFALFWQSSTLGNYTERSELVGATENANAEKKYCLDGWIHQLNGSRECFTSLQIKS